MPDLLADTNVNVRVSLYTNYSQTLQKCVMDFMRHLAQTASDAVRTGLSPPNLPKNKY